MIFLSFISFPVDGIAIGSLFLEIAIAGILFASLILLCRATLKKKAEVINQKANIRVSAHKSKIRIENVGKCSARNIRIDSPDMFDSGRIRLNVTDDFFPYESLNPNESIEINLSCSSIKNPYEVKLSWDDDFKKNAKRKQLVDL